MSKDYNQIATNAMLLQMNSELLTHKEYGKFANGKDAISYTIFWQGDKVRDIALIRRRLNAIRNELGISKTAANNYIFMAGMETVENDLKEQNEEIDILVELREKLYEVQWQKSVKADLCELYAEIDECHYSTEEFNKVAVGLGFNPLDFEKRQEK